MFIGIAGLTTTNEFQEVQMDDSIIYSLNDQSTHDALCNCGYCTEGNEENYYRLELQDDKIWMIDNLNGDTIANLTDNKQLQTIIQEDNK